MLELTQDQIDQLRQGEHEAFVGRVREELVTRYPDLKTDNLLTSRLLAAHRAALAFGLHSPEARTQFLYQESFAPGFYQQSAISAWLRKEGAHPEQRWRDFVAYAAAKMEAM